MKLRFLLILFTFVIFLPARSDAKPPNVVMIISDDQRWTDFGFMGHPTIQTPHLDRLAEQSAVFERGYVPSSLCRPSLATLISGLYPHQHRITGNDPPKGTDRAKMLKHIRRIPKLPQMLATKGYVSHQSGKWWEGSHKLGGFTAGMTHGDPKRGGRHGDEGLKIGREGMQPIFNFVDGCGDKPFFLWYAPFLPHTPHTPPARLLKKYTAPYRPIELARYFAMCEWFDETCGQLLSHLDKKGLSENSLVVFVTDNGWIQQTPKTKVADGWRFKFAPKSKRSPYDGGIRTPIMLRWPGKISPGHFDTLVSSIDLAPTILAAANVKRDPSMQGINLLKVIANNGKTNRRAIFGGVYAHDVVDIDEPYYGLNHIWCIEDNFKIIHSLKNKKPLELYHISGDPYESTNLGLQHPKVVARFRQLINNWWPSAKDE